MRFSTISKAVAAVGIASVATMIGVTPASAAPTIDTYSVWNGTDYVWPMGHPDTSTYGQTVTIPAGKTTPKKFAFWMAPNSGDGTIKMRGAIYAWDGDSATGTAVWESKKAKNVEFSLSDPTYQRVQFKTKGAGAVTPGSTYVFFASISKDYEATDPGVLCQWGANYFDALAGGDVVYINDAGDESQWTNGTWSTIFGYDFAMKATIK
jgi:hypothetical protein